MTEQKLVKRINKSLSSINHRCNSIIKKYQESSDMSHKDYIYFVFSADILYRIKDIIFLNNKLKEAKNSFDSSLYVLSRSVLETFIYLKYLLSEDEKITLRLHSFICYTTGKDISMVNSLKLLGERNKFIFSEDENNILSLKMINEKISEWSNEINSRKNFKKDILPIVEKEIVVLKNVEETAKTYDKVMKINTVKNGEENKSLEWMYNYVYRFQCMSTHQNLRDKEKVFKLYMENKKIPNNMAVLGLMDDISKQVLDLCS